MKLQSYHKFIYKLSSKRLRDADWKLSLSFCEALKETKEVVSLNNSQILRWIDEIKHQPKRH